MKPTVNDRRMEKLNYLTTIDIFRDLSRNEIEAIDRQLSMSTSPAGNVFYTPQETGEMDCSQLTNSVLHAGVACN